MKLPMQVPLLGEVPLLKNEEKAAAADPRDKVLIETGLFPTGKTFIFRCPVCGKVEGNDQRLELACSGPSWRNDHELTPMIFVGKK